MISHGDKGFRQNSTPLATNQPPRNFDTPHGGFSGGYPGAVFWGLNVGTFWGVSWNLDVGGIREVSWGLEVGLLLGLLPIFEGSFNQPRLKPTFF